MSKLAFRLKEEVDPRSGILGSTNLDDEKVRESANSLLGSITARAYVTPYIGLEKVMKTLAYFNATLPKYTFLQGKTGKVAFPLRQFGEMVRMQDDGKVVTKDLPEYHLLFQWRDTDLGFYKIDAQIVPGSQVDEMDSIKVIKDRETGPKRTPGSAVSGLPLGESVKKK